MVRNPLRPIVHKLRYATAMMFTCELAQANKFANLGFVIVSSPMMRPLYQAWFVVQEQDTITSMQMQNEDNDNDPKAYE